MTKLILMGWNFLNSRNVFPLPDLGILGVMGEQSLLPCLFREQIPISFYNGLACTGELGHEFLRACLLALECRGIYIQMSSIKRLLSNDY